MVLKPQDILVALQLGLHPGEDVSYPALAGATGLSVSEAHAAVRRCRSAGIVSPNDGPGRLTALRENLLEFLVHGVRYAFPADRLGVARGVPTAHSAPVLAGAFETGSDALPFVWPSPAGRKRGQGISPLYRSVPEIAEKNDELYGALALVDAIRVGRARERSLAAKLLRGRLLGED